MSKISTENHNALLNLKTAYLQLSWYKQRLFPGKLGKALASYPEDRNDPAVSTSAFFICTRVIKKARFIQHSSFDCLVVFSRTYLFKGMDMLNAKGLSASFDVYLSNNINSRHALCSLVNALIWLRDTGLLTAESAQANHEVLIAARDDFDSMTCALVLLHDAGLLVDGFAQANRQALIAARKNPMSMVGGLIKLHKAGLLAGDCAQANREVLIAAKGDLGRIAGALVDVHQAGLLAGDFAPANREMLLAAKGHILNISLLISILKVSNLLTGKAGQVNFAQFIIPYAAVIFSGSYGLWRRFQAAERISQVELDVLCQQPATEQRALDFLFSHAEVFAYAETHEQEYRAYTLSFSTKKIAALRAQREGLRAENPNGIFNLLAPQEIKLCYYIIRTIIRGNERSRDGDLFFLLGIPAVKECVIREEPNKLMQLAVSMGNQVAVDILLVVPSLKPYAQPNRYYRGGADGRLDLGASLCSPLHTPARFFSQPSSIPTVLENNKTAAVLVQCPSDNEQLTHR